MRVLIVSQHFPPEVTAASARVEAFADGLAERGHDVEVLCEVPNHPTGIVELEYRRHAVVRRDAGSYRVSHVWVRANPAKTTRSRLLLYGTFAAAAATIGSGLRRPDVILTSSPPLPGAAAAALLAARFRVPWVFDVRDLWPAAAVLLGELRGERIIHAAERLERRLYSSAAAITVTTEPFREQVVAHGGAPEKITVVPNGTTQAWLDAGALESERGSMDLPTETFLWTYAGNLGIAQGLESAIDAAGILGDGFSLVLLGAGPRRADLERRAAGLTGADVSFRGLVPPAQAARYMRASDALLVPLDPQPGLRAFVPSKLFDSCAVGRPVILAAEGESRRLAEASGAVLPVPPGDAAALAGAIRRLRDDPALGAALSAAGREFARGYLRSAQIDRLESILERAAR